jgi:hypothetical protein
MISHLTLALGSWSRLDDHDPGRTPNFEAHPVEFAPLTKSRPVGECCELAVVTWFEFVWTRICPVHGRKDGGNAD